LQLRTLNVGRVLLCLAATLFAGAAQAEPGDVDACADASEHGQRLRDEGRFRAARAELLSCAREGCPGIVARDCVAFLAELDARTPSLVVRAMRANGEDVADFSLSIDGEVVPNAASGRAILVDPGPHRLRFTAPGEPPLERAVVARERDTHRDVTITFSPLAAVRAALPPARAAERHGRLTPTVAALGATGLVALAVGGVLGIKGIVDHKGYEACAPNCDPSAVDGTRRLVLVADVLGGVGLVATTLATVLFFGRAPERTPRGAPAASVAPGGFTAGWSTRF
jgi:hypothetical protein